MQSKKRILLKLTGEIFLNQQTNQLDPSFINQVIQQLVQLTPTHQFGIVMGGGNFFRGYEHGTRLGVRPTAGHQVGMLATILNGLILKDLLEQQNCKATLFCAIPTPGIGLPTSQQEIDTALEHDSILIFTGGTGNPFFTTDTNAVLRALQIEADEIWKGTNVDGVYDADPHQNPHAKLLPQLTYTTALERHLAIMDATAFVLAQQHHQTIRVFNIFTHDALLHAARDAHFGSVIT